MSDATASSTGVEILVQIPGITSTSIEISEGSSTFVYPEGVVFRGRYTPTEPTLSPSQLESGSPHESSLSDSPDASGISSLDILNAMLSLLSLGSLIGVALLSFFCTNVLLFRRPLAYALELEPILAQAKNCQEEALPFLCADERQDGAMPKSLFSLQRSWERYLEGKIKEWSSCSYGTGILVGFILGALQIAENNDPLTRVFAFIAYATLAFSLMVNQLLLHHLNDKYAKEVHFAYHLLERAEKEKSSTWNLHCLLSISSVSTWWGIVLSIFTFASMFYHDTATTGSSADSVLPLSLGEMVSSRVVMVAHFLISVSCLFSMHATLKSYGKAAEHTPLPSPAQQQLQDNASQIASPVSA
ncbi:hypothetical protein MVEN_01017800 [Mycena venus]|uniref:Uncharacterized protein n=1 Tax=Mycena venus TaxID=2733690 RepID=A0A8H6YEI1_9AGAR|nr:hypothetical protein MVEN_01017800 [Mycena venus]